MYGVIILSLLLTIIA